MGRFLAIELTIKIEIKRQKTNGKISKKIRKNQIIIELDNILDTSQYNIAEYKDRG